MSKIRTLLFNERRLLNKMISLLSEELVPNDNSFIFPYFSNLLSNFLPLKYKNILHSYSVLNNNKLQATITVKSEKGNGKKCRITQLFSRENSFLEARQLIDYVVALYIAKGVTTFIANINICDEEILELFTKGCGFKFCSFIQLWQMNRMIISSETLCSSNIRIFANTDSEAVAKIYNDNILPHYRYSLYKEKEEFLDNLFCGLNKTIQYKYVIEEPITQQISGFLQIKTTDNYNYYIDLTLSPLYNDNIEEIISFAIKQIYRRTSNFNIFIINKNYMQNAQVLEEFLKTYFFTLKQTQAVLIKDYIKQITNPLEKFSTNILLSEVKSKPAYFN